ncbi:hypothetical protein TWF730_008108 [Orbilia blumenaviensis]|uniref:BTB domain-containing protein n=1 Tax=Orbilia blumenaviensis TaxID=1796055 RepID=A0AAV9VC86_9PEZI
MSSNTESCQISHGRVCLRVGPPDLAIRCGNRIFKVHQEQVLGKPGILDAVRYEGITDGCATIVAHDIEPTVLSCMIDYFYTGDFDETGENPRVPSTNCLEGGDGIQADSPFKSPSGSACAERNKRLAAVYTMAQKYRINDLKEVVKKKFACDGKLSEYLTAIVKDNSITAAAAADMGQTLHAKLEKVALTTVDSPETDGNGDEEITNSEETTTKSSNSSKPLEEEKVNNPTNTPVIPDTFAATALCSMEALNENLINEVDSLRTANDQQAKEIADQKSQLLILNHEKRQAELSRDTAMERLDGLMKVLNETKRCKNTGCQTSLNVSVQENEVRTGGNITIRCGSCNARQR